LTYVAEIKINIPPNAILIFQSDLPWGLPQNFVVDDSVTAFFWNCYPFNLIPVLPGRAREWMSASLFKTKLLLNTLLLPAKIKCRRFLEGLTKHGAIAFMDLPNLDLTEKALNFKIKIPTYLPILLPDTKIRSTRTLDPELALTGAWVGRIADFKINSLAFTLQEIQGWCDRNKMHFIFNVIGDGDRIGELKLLLQESAFLKINFLGSMSSNELEGFLAKDVDIVFAMGTSALEGARLEIPTVLLDFSYSKFPSYYKFKWLHDSNHFSLGAPLDLVDFSSGKNIDAIIHDLNNKSIIAKKCRKYFEDNHNLARNTALFIELAEKSSFRYHDFLKSKDGKKPAYYNIMKLFKTHKS
jgi:hypothetical protein